MWLLLLVTYFIAVVNGANNLRNRGNDLYRQLQEAADEVRTSIASGVVITTVGSTAFVTLDGAELIMLPDKAFGLTNLSAIEGKQEVVFSFTNCGIAEVKSNAFQDPRIAALNKISFNFNNNSLSQLPSSLFASPLAESLVHVDLSNNSFEDLDNAEELFGGSTLEKLTLDSNEIENLPVLVQLAPASSNITISCNNCEKLVLIQEGYCTLFNLEHVLLEIQNTPISQRLTTETISNFTACGVNNIKEDEESRELVGCEDIIEIERAIIRKAVAEQAQALAFYDSVTVTIYTNTSIPCLPNAVLHHLLNFDIAIYSNRRLDSTFVPTPEPTSFPIDVITGVTTEAPSAIPTETPTLAQTFNLNTLSLNFSNLGFYQVETNALASEYWNILSEETEVSISFSDNQLSTLPAGMFIHVAQRPLSLDISSNAFENIDNSFELFNGTGLKQLTMNANPVITLPIIEGRNSSTTNLTVSCENCINLVSVATGYCSNVLPTGNLTLVVTNTPIGEKFSSNDLALVTDCNEESIFGAIGKFQPSECKDMNFEMDRELLRKLIGMNANAFVKQRVFTVEIPDSFQIPCLVDEALKYVDFSGLNNGMHEFRLRLIGLGIEEMEPEALYHASIRKFYNKFFVNLNGNRLSWLDSSVLEPLSGKKLHSLGLRDNLFETIDNSEEVFSGAKFGTIALNGNPLKALPLLSGVTPVSSNVKVSCDDCEKLEQIQTNYCLGAVSTGSVVLRLLNTPISDKLNVSTISEITGCEEGKIVEDDALQRQLVSCEGMLEIEKQQIKKRIADNVQVEFFPDVVTVSLTGVEIPCLPNKAFSETNLGDVSLLPPDTEIELKFEDCRISEYQSGPFIDSRFDLLSSNPVSVHLPRNNISKLAFELFLPFHSRLRTFNISHNPLPDLSIDLGPSIFALFFGTKAVFDGTGLTELVFSRAFIPIADKLLVSCVDCLDLNHIEPGLCSKLSLLGTKISLDLRGTIFANTYTLESLSQLTECSASNIII